ncbi:bifunctional enoyl-CoA hydratase/phosphate acetyltransferase [Ferrovum myxofaciens]|uniref:Bifunctional enoyl-CoA hydratase/phosphate acetyltransferase n=1 Tax=Ferrovum myxofaciens TaxID=416213 RepID=A0A9E6MYV5_9PROT|nr:bifunctional enoyl-CoA hydratase/phosphate acetyltransferase [Ferrovum myxofaciens]QKE39687.2 MAG: bifunctional enoyl-CoA hydratase/phosphate acetyltransferase [Ferrovum myxofaciens]QWY75521.1 MAG: bifunctional enoyl-CoA hydratase/phosphate acetyltransferase [Ferrovum myxofaciens]QWY78259.1 MAG: bifunctional enoyl-CoA hydratase/phosphate acetyltransferase [Ferrovum myxofaciens]
MNETAPLSPRFAMILERARHHPSLPVAVVDAQEAHVLAGVLEASDYGLIEPVLLGPQAQIEAVCRRLGCPVDRFPILNRASATEAAEAGVQLVLEGKAAALVKGWIHTDELMRPVLRQLRTARRVSHVFVADLPSYHKLLFITDAAINIVPDLATKAAILQNAIDLVRILGVDRPKVAALSAVELVKPSIPSSLDAACLSKMAQRGQITHAEVDGPLAFDNAISCDAAKIKQINSTVAGEADILLAPDLDAGNILAKGMEYLAGATLAGIVIGARVPLMLTSRSDPPAARLISAAIAVLLHQHWDGDGVSVMAIPTPGDEP